MDGHSLSCAVERTAHVCVRCRRVLPELEPPLALTAAGEPASPPSSQVRDAAIGKGRPRGVLLNETKRECARASAHQQCMLTAPLLFCRW